MYFSALFPLDGLGVGAIWEAPMILPNLPESSYKVLYPVHPVWGLGFFGNEGGHLWLVTYRDMGGYDTDNPRLRIWWKSLVPLHSWHAAQAIYRAFLRKFEE